jgi:hypothetical protein
MNKLTKTQKALALLKRADQLTIALTQLKKQHQNNMGGKICLTRLSIINDIDDTLELLK